MNLKPHLLLLSALILLSACTPPSPEPAGGINDEPLVIFRRSGGIAGFDDRVEISAEGGYTVARRGAATTVGQLSADELAQLLAALDASDLFDADATHEAQGADLFIYAVTYNGHTLSAQDGAVPDPFYDILDLLEPLIQ